MTTKKIFLILTLLGAIALCFPELSYYPLLSQGDHGRDLYAAQAVLRGEVPYKDFWWVYGPIMPYYYAFFYKLTGGTIMSFLIGKALLKIACTVLFYLGATIFMVPSIAMIAALWFCQSQQDFFFTFNHLGGITAELAILFLLFSYITKREMKFIWASLPIVFIYCLIKINFGLASLAIVVSTVALVNFIFKLPFDQNIRKFYLASIIGVPLFTGLVYGIMLNGLTINEIRQCMPYFGDDQPHHFPPSMTIPYFFQQHWMTFYHSWLNFQNSLSALPSLFSAPSPLAAMVQFLMITGGLLMLPLNIIMHASTVIVVVLFLTGRIPEPSRRHLWVGLASLGLFFVLNFHEFVVSGVWYRTFWSLPFLFMFHFMMMSTALGIFPALLRRICFAGFVIMLTIGLIASTFSTTQQKIPSRFLNGTHAKVYVGNEPQWTETVNTVSQFLNQNLKEGESFLALPYDCIYYYLTNTKSPTRQLIFFDHIKIPPQQEVKIIKELDSANVQYVLLSNRMSSQETGLGTFGQSYCPLISNYIGKNFVPINRIGGKWKSPPGWGNNHGVLILKRK